MDEIIKKAIQITGIEAKDGKITLLEQVGNQQYPTRYSFFETFPDGGETEPYQQFKELNPTVGQTVTIGVKEVKKTNQFGKEVTYRNVAYFATGDTSDTTPTPQQPSAVQNKPQAAPLAGNRSIKLAQDRKAEFVQQAQDRGNEAMKQLAICRDASQIVNALITSGMFIPTSDDEARERIKDWIKWYSQEIYIDRNEFFKRFSSPF